MLAVTLNAKRNSTSGYAAKSGYDKYAANPVEEVNNLDI
jgi:hypothetical protein